MLTTALESLKRTGFRSEEAFNNSEIPSGKYSPRHKQNNKKRKDYGGGDLVCGLGGGQVLRTQPCGKKSDGFPQGAHIPAHRLACNAQERHGQSS